MAVDSPYSSNPVIRPGSETSEQHYQEPARTSQRQRLSRHPPVDKSSVSGQGVGVTPAQHPGLVVEQCGESGRGLRRVSRYPVPVGQVVPGGEDGRVVFTQHPHEGRQHPRKIIRGPCCVSRFPVPEGQAPQSVKGMRVPPAKHPDLVGEQS